MWCSAVCCSNQLNTKLLYVSEDYNWPLFCRQCTVQMMYSSCTGVDKITETLWCWPVITLESTMFSFYWGWDQTLQHYIILYCLCAMLWQVNKLCNNSIFKATLGYLKKYKDGYYYLNSPKNWVTEHLWSISILLGFLVFFKNYLVVFLCQRRRCSCVLLLC